MKKHLKVKKLTDPISIRETCSKNYVDNKFTNDIDCNDVKLASINFVKVNYQPAVNEHLTPIIYVDNEIDKTSLARNNQNNDFNNHTLTNLKNITLNTQAVNDNHVITKVMLINFTKKNNNLDKI